MSKKKKGKKAVTPPDPLKELVKDKRPVFRFLGAFGVCIVLFYVFYNSTFYENHLEYAVLNTQAHWSAGFLRLMGYKVDVFGDIISSNQFRISIRGGCDGLEATALFVLAILVFPIAFKLKWPGILAGLLILAILNILRISGLFIVGTHFNTLFDFFHLNGGIVLFTLASIVLWIIWVNWSFSKMKS